MGIILANLVSFKLIIWKPLSVNPYCQYLLLFYIESIITDQQEDKVNSVYLDWLLRPNTLPQAYHPILGLTSVQR
jgi:hypothetical protein